MKRRTFLQRIGFILAALGVTEAGWLSLGNRYYQALAQPSPRKLALLIGINKYPQNLALGGCLTDVELQKELLIYRFGFQESDILTLTDEQATREKIENAFLDHLVQDAKPSDVVVFHFSGYGSRVKLNAAEESLVNTLIPFDGTYISQNSPKVNCLLEETLMLLWRSLPARVTAILDTSYHAPLIAPSTASLIRAYQMPAKAEFATAELDFQKELKSKSISDRPALLLSATSNPKELAREILLSGFSVGLFTYALTQYLWEATPVTTIIHTLSQVGSSIRQLDGKQQPGLLNSEKNQSKLLSDNFVTESIIGAQGVITAIEEDGKTVQVWLGGIPLQVLEYYGVNSRLSLVSEDANIQIVLRSRNGLTAKAQISDETKSATPIKVGQLVQEQKRVLPKNINLSVALGTKLERIERVDATSGFATISRVSSVIAGEQPADYVFGKLPETKIPDSPASPSRYGLFSLSCELIPNTAGEDGEAAKVAVQRLERRLQTLLAAKLWRLTENEGSSRLAVKASLEIISAITPRVVMQRETVRVTAQSSKKLLSSEAGYVPTVPVGSRMQYRVENLSDRPIYLMLLGLNSSRTAIAFYPTSRSQELNAQTKPPLKEIVIAPGEIITLPKSGTNSEWVIPGSADEYEHQVIFSTAPFTQTLAAVQAAKYSTADKQPIIELSKPLEVAQALLQDLHNASAARETTSQSSDFYAFDVNNWASLSFIFQVV
ncbi:caspase family protein [Tolypothrix sp. VBCCA 56010]|uniref:caspase family protein n=1 Tax=Tolypothrix sp. VBCCA 56010 TaxID=3137731 RepID=UPI003D7C4CB7